MKQIRSTARAIVLAGFLFPAHTLLSQQVPTSTDIPRIISYQGSIAAPDGRPIGDGAYPITVTLYADEAGTQPVWQDAFSASVAGGVFSLALGDGGTPLPDTRAMDRPLWVGVRIDGGAEMRPLTQMSAAPYALNVPAGSITTDKIAPGAVTADKIGADYVSAIHLNGRQITSRGGTLNIEGGGNIGVTFDDATQSLIIGTDVRTAHGKEGAHTLTPVSNVYWSEQGNVGTAAGTDFLGTTDDEPLEIHVYDNDATANRGSKRVMMFAPKPNSPNIVGGFQNNAVSYGEGSFIGGGGANTNVAVIVPGNDYQDIASDYGFIGGGRANRITEDAVHATIGGGLGNQIVSNLYPTPIVPGESGATIGGGGDNWAGGYYATIGGGFANEAYGHFSSVGGGLENEAQGDKSTVAGGEENQADGDYSTVAGGSFNGATQDWATVMGGSENWAYTEYSVVGGGYRNWAGDFLSPSGLYATVVGGQDNWALGDYTFVGGGRENKATTPYSTVAGGQNNEVYADWGAIGGGQANVITETHSVIGGGYGNVVKARWANVDGGQENHAEGDWSTVGGGFKNEAIGTKSTVGGGDNNHADADWSTVGGGLENKATHSISTVAGGSSNRAAREGATIGGGVENEAYGPRSVISGGQHGLIDNLGENSVISGGYYNTMKAAFAAIGGGSGNLVENNGTLVALNAAIPGGDNLIAQSYAQTVIGYYNYPAGSLTARPNRAMTNAINDPLFIIGNGDHSTLPNPTRSNAFEVSYNGHSTVFDVNRTVRDPFYGATYTDNILYSWGRVSGATKNIVPNQEFGVVSVIPGAAIGVYKVSIRVLDPHTSAPVALTEGSVTATLVDDEGSEETPIVCGSITSSPITFAAGLNTFIVKTGSLGVGGTCAPEWRSFMFKVTGRPPVQ